MRRGSGFLYFFLILFFLSLFVVLFFKKVTYKQIIDIYSGKVIKVLPSSVSVKPEKDRIIIFYSTGKEILTGNYNINVKSKWAVWLDWWKHFRKWLDVAGGVRLTYKIDLSKYKQAYLNDPWKYFRIKKEVESVIKRNIENRISKLWVADYSIRILNINWEDYLQVEIWWISDIDYAKSVIWKTVELEFMLPFEGKLNPQIVSQRQKLAENILKQVISSWKNLIDFVDKRIIFASQWDFEKQLEYNNWKVWFLISQSKDKLPDFLRIHLNEIEKLGTWQVVPKLFSGYLTKDYDWWFIVRYLWKTVETWSSSNNSQLLGKSLSWNNLTWNVNLSGKNIILKNILNKSKLNKVIKYNFEVLFISKKPYWIIAKDPKTGEILNGAYFKFANVTYNQSGEPVVVINFDDRWREIFCHITQKYTGKQNAIFIWNRLITAPVIREPICWWSAQISGNFTPKEAKKLAKDLNEGALPAKLILVHEEKIAPLLWEKALMWAIVAGVVGFILIAGLLLYMYNIKWTLIALFSLLEFLVVTLAIVKLIDYALSLAGISAIILTIGMWVDANILMYERIREELQSWKAYWLAVIDGVKRSWSAIRDWNMTTFMIALLLFSIWMNVFKWFGSMMTLSIILVLSIIVPLTKELLLTVGEVEKIE
jgi:protein-export membrane protein SecD